MLAREYAGDPAVIFMDVNYATSMRADSHRASCGDCLHFCDPGAQDMWVDILWNGILAMHHLGILS